MLKKTLCRNVKLVGNNAKRTKNYDNQMKMQTRRVAIQENVSGTPEYLAGLFSRNETASKPATTEIQEPDFYDMVDTSVVKTMGSIFPENPNRTVIFTGKYTPLRVPEEQIEFIRLANMEKPYLVRPYFKQVHFEYPMVRLPFVINGFKRTNEDYWNILWGRPLMSEDLQKLNPFQRVNHFPGCLNLGRKDNLLHVMNAATRQYGEKEFDFFPKTFELPRDSSAFIKFTDQNPDRLIVTKPYAGSCGRGISVNKASNVLLSKEQIAQHYIADPLLINGLKFDMRLYVAVTSYNPLRVYFFHEGLVRLATQPYDTTDTSSRYSHLTNYSVNKHSKDFIANKTPDRDDVGNKWSLSALRRHFATAGLPQEKMWSDVEEVIVKTLMAVKPKIMSRIATSGVSNDACFEFYGFDVMFDEKLKPWLLEVNILPSLSASSPLDKKIKLDALTQLFHLVGVVPYNRENFDNEVKKLNYLKNTSTPTSHLTSEEKMLLHKAEDELIRAGDYKRIFPCAENPKKYDGILGQMSSNLNRWEKFLVNFEVEKKKNPSKLVQKLL